MGFQARVHFLGRGPRPGLPFCITRLSTRPRIGFPSSDRSGGTGAEKSPYEHPRLNEQWIPPCARDESKSKIYIHIYKSIEKWDVHERRLSQKQKTSTHGLPRLKEGLLF